MGEKLVGFKCLGTEIIDLFLPSSWEAPWGYHQLREQVRLAFEQFNEKGCGLKEGERNGKSLTGEKE